MRNRPFSARSLVSSSPRPSTDCSPQPPARPACSPAAGPEDFDNLEGRDLHRLRHSALTHDAGEGTPTPMLLARSRHASVRSLERYARPGVDAVAQHVAQHLAERAPSARRQHCLINR
ncbi:hypothetical protein [Streptomyces sp. NBC_00648]|uniref:hypothetical protein n=1 Tax=Streptomyces sp. NBC_00648 TaxID=2975797 RepID=UPI0032468811